MGAGGYRIADDFRISRVVLLSRDGGVERIQRIRCVYEGVFRRVAGDPITTVFCTGHAQEQVLE